MCDSIKMINEIIVNEYGDGLKRINNDIFEYRAYRLAGLEEVKKFIIAHEKLGAMTSVELFRSQMDDFACRTKSPTAHFMFSVFYDTATDVLDALISNTNIKKEKLSK